MRRASLLAALALATLAGCDRPLLFAELEVPSLRATMPGQLFPASDTSDPQDWCDPYGPNPGDPPCIQLTIDYDLGGMVPILNEPNVTYNLWLQEVGITLATTQATTDLSGVQQVTISVVPDPADLASAIVVASYVQPQGAPPAQTVTVGGNSNIDLGPYLQAGRLPVRAELVLRSGTPEFTADVTAGFSLFVKLDWGGLL
ncbi:MAG TPA: hypothetical protein VFL83_07915 [Anaeromyxobacter sp.]|nr:hypothetical protein [Anaeromyxobacter sp.]